MAEIKSKHQKRQEQKNTAAKKNLTTDEISIGTINIKEIVKQKKEQAVEDESDSDNLAFYSSSTDIEEQIEKEREEEDFVIDTKKPSGFFYRKRKTLLTVQNKKQSSLLKKFYVASASNENRTPTPSSSSTETFADAAIETTAELVTVTENVLKSFLYGTPSQKINAQASTERLLRGGSNKVTPGKLLDEVSPIPVLNALNSAENIHSIKKKQTNKNIKNKTTAKLQQKKQNKKQHKGHEDADSSMDYDSPVLDDSKDTIEEDNECTGCRKDYYKTTKTDDWIKCRVCERWIHEGCSKYTDLCDLCGKHSRK
ncbi:hypothetical protein RN001_013154 [Aquatica leii]|uniref:Zinc finger PHD-type domain-containing protein n=1 Tax=Aquatica leii TaxID=1421715 RepID=A0AAN7SDP2_9COLE|nr:hypothetical protein RN001_013154 [Aquatica leii]